MPRYIKFCPICQKEFPADRISATYCTKKCRNRASKLPADMLEILVIGANNRTKILNTVPKIVRDFLSKEINARSLPNDLGSKNMDAILTEAEEFALEELKKRKKNEDNLPTLDIGE